MMHSRTVRFLLICMLAALLAACASQAADPVETASPTVTAVRIAPTQALSVETSTPTVLPSSTVPPLTQAPSPAIISPKNAAALTSVQLDAPQWTTHMLWPKDPPRLLLQSDGKLYPVDLEKAEIGEPAALPETEILDVTLDASRLLARQSGGLAVYDLSGERLVGIDAPGAYGASFSPDGGFIAVTSYEEWRATLYDAQSGERITSLTGFETAAPVYGVAPGPGAKTLAWIARATLQFQDAETGQMGRRIGYQDFIGAYTFSPDGAWFAVNAGSRLEVLDTSTSDVCYGTEVSQPVRSLAFSPDGRLLAAGYGDMVQMWETSTWTPLPPLAGHVLWIKQVSFSPDGRFLVSLDEEDHLRIWSSQVP